jgi:diguanylate cyclase (GGDEF)-like protein/PAS domain S-box-containing protein
MGFLKNLPCNFEQIRHEVPMKKMEKGKPGPTNKTDELRRRAEEKALHRHASETPPPTEADGQRLVHELQVHQIELEMQNEELRQARVEIEAGLERYTDLYDFAPVGYFSLGGDGTISQVNLYGAKLLGLERARLVGRRFGLFVALSRTPSFNTFLERVFKSPDRHACEEMMQKEGGEPFWVQLEAVVGADGQECRMVMIDIHARKLAEMKLQHLNMHDSLTGLYNRAYFMASLERLERGRQYPISVLMADVDQLKTINDRQGHACGDDLLRRAAQVLTLAFRAEDIIARIGGDEFAVLLPETNAKAAEAVQRRFYEMLKEHNTNHFTENPISISSGISTAAEYGISLSETLKEADSRMYQHKRG